MAFYRYSCEGVNHWDPGQLHAVRRSGKEDRRSPQTFPRQKPNTSYRNQDQKKTYSKSKSNIYLCLNVFGSKFISSTVCLQTSLNFYI